MKKVALLLMLISFSIFGQKAIFNKINSEGNFTEYETKEGVVLKIGDTLKIGYPRNTNFTFITQGGVPATAFLSNTKVVVTKLKSVGNKTRGFKMYALFKGYGLVPVYIDYDSAFETGEIK